MTTQTETKKELEQKADRLWACYNGMGIDFLTFGTYANRANVAPCYGYIEEAEHALANIEDSIKRYREGRPQHYEEVVPKGVNT